MTGQPRPKATPHDRVRLLTDVDGCLTQGVPAGTVGGVVEAYTTPIEGYAVEVAFRNSAGEREYDNVILHPSQFDVLRHPSGLSIDADSEPPTVLAVVAEILGGRAEDGRVRTAVASVEMTGPWERDVGLEQRTGYRVYRYEALAEALPGVGRDEMVRSVSTLLSGLWARDIPACARSQYNDRLPDDGGCIRWLELRPGERGTYPGPAAASGDGGAA